VAELAEHGPTRELLERAGYDASHRAREFPVWLEKQDVIKLDLVAFGRSSPLDMTTATVVCGYRDSSTSVPIRLLRAAGALAAPVVLTASHSTFDVWPTAESATPLIRGVPFDAPDPQVLQLLRPDHLLAAKVGHRQLPLFPVPVDLLQSARQDRAARLEPLIQASFATAVEHYSRVEEDPETIHKKAARLVVGTLTTLALRDKHDLRQLDPTTLLKNVAEKFPRNFDWLPRTRALDRRLLLALLEELGTWIDYASLDTTILSEVYESALVEDEQRAALGIHYTPPGVARRLLAELPVEILPPDQRHVLDPACGSGTLLVAAHDRLRSLQPSNWPESVRHEDLRVHVRGYDKDPFAAEIARLALLLNAMPAGNGWHIETGDSLTSAPLISPQPSIVVANPPWKHTRAAGEATELADAFVRAITELVRPGGLFAILLPASWLSSQASSATRQLVQSRSEIYEVWRLPPHTFPTSNARAIAILGRMHHEGEGRRGGASRVIRVIRPGELQEFAASGRASETDALPLATEEDDKPLAHPLALTFDANHIRLGDIATVRSGPQPKKGIKSGSGTALYLDDFGLVPPYQAVEQEQTWRVNYPDDFVGAWGASLIDRKKVLLSAIRFNDTPWCVKSVVDEIGIAVRNSAHMAAPKDVTDDDAVYALFAFSCSGFFNCWIDEHAVGVNIPTRVTRSVPIPHGPDFNVALAELGRSIMGVSPSDSSDLHELLLKVEDTVWHGFGKVPLAHEICSKRLAGWTAPEGGIRYTRTSRDHSKPESLDQRRFGYVMEVLQGKVRLWVNGLTPDDGTVTRTPSRMPGWLLRPGATFDVTSYGSGLEDAQYVLQAHSYENFEPTPESAAH
jgi:SAM-dependent methyltransferase